jgi:hypothetical protein
VQKYKFLEIDNFCEKDPQNKKGRETDSSTTRDKDICGYISYIGACFTSKTKISSNIFRRFQNFNFWKVKICFHNRNALYLVASRQLSHDKLII